MGNENQPRTLGGNVLPLRSDTIRLVQNECAFYGLQSEDPNQHLKDFLKLVDSLDLNVVPTTLSTAWKIPSKLLSNMRLRVPMKREASGTLSNPSKTILVTPIFRRGKVTQTLDARLSKFETDFKQQQSEMTDKINTVLKAITDRITGALPSDTIKNTKLNVKSTSPVLSAHSYPMKDPQCSSRIHSLINAIVICLEQPNKSCDNKLKEEKEEKGNPKNININPP
nr:zinc finger, CCHC-type [Tanacetum cinerariifolium]